MKKNYQENNKKLVIGHLKNIRISNTKLNFFLKNLRKKSYKECLVFLNKKKNKICLIIWKLLNSIISTAINIFFLDKNKLIISKAIATKSTILKRLSPRAKGKSFLIQKKLSHLFIEIQEI